MEKNVTRIPMTLSKEGQIVCLQIYRSHSFGIFNGDNPLEYSVPIMLLQLSVLMVITRTLRFILKPLRQPRVVSEILVSSYLSSYMYIFSNSSMVFFPILISFSKIFLAICLGGGRFHFDFVLIAGADL